MLHACPPIFAFVLQCLSSSLFLRQKISRATSTQEPLRYGNQTDSNANRECMPMMQAVGAARDAAFANHQQVPSFTPSSSYASASSLHLLNLSGGGGTTNNNVAGFAGYVVDPVARNNADLASRSPGIAPSYMDLLQLRSPATTKH